MKTTYRQYFSLFLSLLILLTFSQMTYAATTQVDILFMNHGPMRPTVAKIKTLMVEYGDKVQADWYDVDLQAGKAFLKKQKITGHIPMLIQIDGKSEFEIDGRSISLKGFPTGASPFKRVEGNWSLDDLKILLDKETR